MSEFQTIKIGAIGEQEVREFRIEDLDEGYVLEHGTWHLLETLFGTGIFHSPRVTEGSKLREFTDILAFCEGGLCLIECKATGVLSTDPCRTTERRAKNVQKQIEKGLAQLPGAMRNIAARAPLTSIAGKVIQFPEEMLDIRHAIIMVSELLPAVDWEAVATRLLHESKTTQTLFHVLDLQELRKLVGVSQNKPLSFIAQLTHRFQSMKECNSAYLRMQFKGPPLP